MAPVLMSASWKKPGGHQIQHGRQWHMPTDINICKTCHTTRNMVSICHKGRSSVTGSKTTAVTVERTTVNLYVGGSGSCWFMAVCLCRSPSVVELFMLALVSVFKTVTHTHTDRYKHRCTDRQISKQAVKHHKTFPILYHHLFWEICWLS